MKLHEEQATTLIRIQFGMKEVTKSVSFEDTTVFEVYDLFLKVFSDWKITKTLKLENHCPLSTIKSNTSLTCMIREEFGREKKPASKSKSLYGVSSLEAHDYFVKNYKKHLL